MDRSTRRKQNMVLNLRAGKRTESIARKLKPRLHGSPRLINAVESMKLNSTEFNG
jgi:hypothetical protein